MHYGNACGCQDDLISTSFDLDQHQNIRSPQTECNSLLSLCPYKQIIAGNLMLCPSQGEPGGSFWLVVSDPSHFYRWQGESSLAQIFIEAFEHTCSGHTLVFFMCHIQLTSAT
jgi:hypothetical protein